MLLVIAGHLTQVYLWKENTETAYFAQTVELFSYSFHMPLFVFLSGMFSLNTKKRQDEAFAGLFLPYLFVQITLGSLILLFTHSPIYLRNLFAPVYGSWYLLVLFVWRTLLPYLSKAKHVLLFALLFNLLMAPMAIGTELALSRITGFLLYFMMGYWYAQRFGIDQLEQHFHRSIFFTWTARLLLLIELPVMYLLLKTGTMVHETWLALFIHRFHATSLHEAVTGTLAYAICLLLAVFNSVLLLAAIPAKSKFLSRIGHDTMPIYVSHLYIVNIAYYLTLPLRGISYAVVAIAVALLCLLIFPSARYCSLFHRGMHRLQRFCLRE